MAKMSKVADSLSRRIVDREADPISDREREQLQEMRQVFISRFGYDPEPTGHRDVRSVSVR